MYPGATLDHVEVTNGTSEANYLLALALLRPGDEVALKVPNYMQYGGVPQSLGASVNPSACASTHDWEPDWEEFERAVTPKTRLVYLSNPQQPYGQRARPKPRCGASWRAARQVGAYLLADEVYLGAEIDARDAQLLGHERSRDRHQRALQGLWHSRRAHRLDRGTARVVAECWTQHDYITIGPNKISDAVARIAVQPENREKLYARTRDDPAAQSADDARVGRELRRLPHLPRAAGRRASA